MQGARRSAMLVYNPEREEYVGLMLDTWSVGQHIVPEAIDPDFFKDVSPWTRQEWTVSAAGVGSLFVTQDREEAVSWLHGKPEFPIRAKAGPEPEPLPDTWDQVEV